MESDFRSETELAPERDHDQSTIDEKPKTACPWPLVLGIGGIVLLLLTAFVSFKLGQQSGPELDQHEAPRSGQNSSESPEIPVPTTNVMENLCTTKGCTEAASLIDLVLSDYRKGSDFCIGPEMVSKIENMNPALDPCEDFHEYACGGWNQIHADPLVMDFSVKLNQQLLELIMNDKSGMAAVEKANAFYENCKALRAENFNADLQNYVKKLGEVRLIGQELHPGMEMPSLTYSVLMTFLFHPWSRPPNTFLRVQATIEPKISIVFNEPWDIFFGGQKEEMEMRTAVEKAVTTLEPLGFTINKETRQAQTDELVALYMKLRAVFDNKLTNKEFNYSINELQEIAPMYDWLHFIRWHLPNYERQLTGQTHITYKQEYDVAAISKVLLDTPRHVVQNFLFLNWARHLKERFDQRAQIGCQIRVLYYFRKLSEHLAIGKIRFKSDVEDVKNLGKEMRRGFHRVFDENTWLDEETKTYLKQRLDAIKEYYGYNNNALDKKKIDGFYETLPVPDEWTLITMMQFEERAAWFVQHMDLMGEPALEPAMPLRAFNGGNKLIAISLGMIAAPFYNPNWPLEFHYAGIGQIIAHELTHSFDEQGDLPSGNVGNDTDEFEGKAKCFEDQFGNIIYENPRFNITAKADGAQQRIEALPDNNGIRIAWRAYLEKRQKLYGRNPPKLPGLQEFTNDQLCYLANAQFYCGRQDTIYPNQTPGERRWLEDRHPVPNVRLNGLFQNFKPFATTFKCKPNTPMNPPRECRVWRHRIH